MIFFKYNQQPNSTFPDRTLRAEHKSVWIFKIGSVVQKIHLFLCLKPGPEVGKVLNRDKEGNVANQMAPKRYWKSLVFLFLFKNYKSYHHEIWLHTGKKECWIHLQCQKKKKVSCHRSEIICINCILWALSVIKA